MQAASVTTTSTWCDQQLPSASRATATSCCEVASRMRVDTLRCPARGPKWKRTTSLLRVALVEQRDRRHFGGVARLARRR